MNIRSILFSVAMAFGATTAQAATLDTVTAVVGGPTITDFGFLNSLPPLGNSVLGTAASGSTAVGDILVLNADFVGLSNLFAATSSILSPGTTYLTGTFIEAADDAALVTVLYQTTGGSAAADFGSLFRLTFAEASITDGLLTSGLPFFSGPGSITVEAVINPVPLPASGIFLLAASGSLIIARRRKTA